MMSSKASKKTQEPESAFDLLPKSISAVKNNVGLFLLVSLTGLVTTARYAQNPTVVNINNLSNLSPGAVLQSLFGVSLGLVVALAVVSWVLQTMAIGLQLKVAKGKKPTLAELWEVARKYTFRYLGLGILSGLVIIGGFILLIVPGFIAVSRLFLASYVMVDEDKGIVEAMKRSSEISKGFGVSIWGIIGVSMLITIIAQFIFSLINPVLGGIAGVLAGMAYSVAPAFRYLELKSTSNPVNDKSS
jgi:hypothetical protein